VVQVRRAPVLVAGFAARSPRQELSEIANVQNPLSPRSFGLFELSRRWPSPLEEGNAIEWPYCSIVLLLK